MPISEVGYEVQSCMPRALDVWAVRTVWIIQNDQDQAHSLRRFFFDYSYIQRRPLEKCYSSENCVKAVATAPGVLQECTENRFSEKKGKIK